ncbi:MAG: hypothetical protein RMJ33_13895 [Saprospiraceae bacterium]|nr:hypothetical protein [Saprospiraceae bacterium]
MNEPATIRSIAQRTNQKPDTLARRLRRAGFKGVGLDRPLSDEQVRILFEVERTPVRKLTIDNKRIKRATHADVSTSHGRISEDSEQARAHLRLSVESVVSAIASAALLFVSLGHGLLVVSELSELAGSIGTVAGVVVMSVIIACIALSSSSRWEETSAPALWFVFWLDVAAIYLHYRAFKPYLGVGLSLGLAIVVSVSAFMALYLFRSKNNQFQG